LKSSVSVAVNKKLITLDNDIKHNSRYEPVRNRSINKQPEASAGKRRISQFLIGWKTTPLFLIGWSMLHVSFFDPVSKITTNIKPKPKPKHNYFMYGCHGGNDMSY